LPINACRCRRRRARPATRAMPVRRSERRSPGAVASSWAQAVSVRPSVPRMNRSPRRRRSRPAEPLVHGRSAGRAGLHPDAVGGLPGAAPVLAPASPRAPYCDRFRPRQPGIAVRHCRADSPSRPWHDRRCRPVRPAAVEDRMRGRCGRGRRPVRPRTSRAAGRRRSERRLRVLSRRHRLGLV